jgi:hypothetical protein
MLSPFLLIGVGGSGGKTLRGLRYQLELVLRQKGWNGGIPQAWQFIHVDTPIAQDGKDYPAPFLPADMYKGLVSGGMTYRTVYNGVANSNAIAEMYVKDVSRQFPDPNRVQVPVHLGAGQYRAVGRTVILASPRQVEVAAREAISRMTDASALGQLQTLGEELGVRTDGAQTPSPTVIFVSSIAGGSGAGQFLDVIEIVKSTVTFPWKDHFISLLYAPDVFDQLDVTGGMPGNALAAVSEAMNGFWTTTPSDVTLELLRTKGIAPEAGEPMVRVGAAYPFIIGRRNSQVTFANQGEVYSAVATSLAAWMTDDRLQDALGAYVIGNWQTSVDAMSIPDATGLMRPAYQSPPFSTIGFGRVTLGRERFLEYASERIARSVVDRLLEAHIEDDRQCLERTAAEWVDAKAAQAYEQFIRTLRLNEETEDANDIIDQLRDDVGLATLAASVRTQVEQRSVIGLDKSGGLDLNTWTERLKAEFQSVSEAALDQDSANRQQKLAQWVGATPEHVIRTAASYCSEYGLPVVVELLRRLGRDLSSAAEGLRAEAGNYRAWAERLDSYLSEDLREAPNAASIRKEHPAVTKAFATVEEAFRWASEARLRESASEVIDELRKDFIDPLRSHLNGVHRQLVERVDAQRTADGRISDFQNWPGRSQTAVPRKFSPAPNERLLTEHTEYSEEFERLIVATTKSDRYLDAILSVITQAIVGPEKGTVPEEESWSFITILQSWQPVTTADPTLRTAAPRPPRFDAIGDPHQFRDIARIWILQDGTPFGAYIRETLNSWLDASSVTPDVYAERVSRFREQFSAALGASEPLVKLNPKLLSAVHQKAVSDPPALVFGAIPFAQGSDLYELTKNILASRNMWNDNVSPDWFRDQQVESIEVFALGGAPVQPIVMDSVMEPIGRAWISQSAKVDTREAFWRFKRARLLGEAIPADGQVIASMIRGWYAAKALGWLGIARDDLARGPELTVWDAAARERVSFPYPLLHPGIAEAHDYPGVVMESLMAAMVMCTVNSSIAPLRPYQILAELGGQEAKPSLILRDWVQSGVVPDRAPSPAAERAGTPANAVSERQETLRTFFDQELEAFQAAVVAQDPDTSVYDYPVSWEIREEIETAIRTLRSVALAVRAPISGI